ncbi:unnamed protein product [Miscanthus lutarioriparius]|uniref:Calmodulin-binding domain-containing protein n=1 Tax=Miscanthus lutarioriparius TaxID=422564 RepID=A0A811PMT9_9POAL|nr:unnamed protein product [Miscanthus lutarioriparius]
MATSRRDPQQNARVNRGIQNMSPGLKPSESDQGLRRARSVPTSPDRRLSPSPASISSNTCRPASSFNARTTSSRSTSSSASSSHGKTLHSASSMAGARQTNTMRRKAEKPGATSVWPPALAAPNTSSKDMTRAAKSPSTMQKSNNLSTRPGIEKAAASSVKPKSQKTTAGPLGAGKTQAASSTRAPGAITKKRMGARNMSLSRGQQTESISTSSIEEHLHERLPDPVDLKSVDLNSKTSSSLEEYKNQENTGDILEEKHDGKDNEDLSTGDRAYIGNSDINIPKEAVDESESEEAVDETGLKQDVCATELNETVDQTKLNEAASETESKEANDEAKLKQVDCETALKEAASGTELRDAVIEHELIAQEKAKTKEKIMQPTKTVELAQKWRKDEGGAMKLQRRAGASLSRERKNKVMALVGRFETAMSG